MQFLSVKCSVLFILSSYFLRVSCPPKIHYLTELLASDNIIHILLGLYKTMSLIEAACPVIVLQHPYKYSCKAQELKLLYTRLQQPGAKSLTDILGKQINSDYLTAAGKLLPP